MSSNVTLPWSQIYSRTTQCVPCPGLLSLLQSETVPFFSMTLICMRSTDLLLCETFFHLNLSVVFLRLDCSRSFMTRTPEGCVLPRASHPRVWDALLPWVTWLRPPLSCLHHKVPIFFVRNVSWGDAVRRRKYPVSPLNVTHPVLHPLTIRACNGRDCGVCQMLVFCVPHPTFVTGTLLPGVAVPFPPLSGYFLRKCCLATTNGKPGLKQMF